MPLILPKAVKDYTENPKVSARADAKLEMDIRRASKKVLQILGRKEDDAIFTPTVPQDIQDALVLYSEYFAQMEIAKSTGGIKSESFDDYSYTLSDGTTISEPEVLILLTDWKADTALDVTQTKVSLRVSAF